MDALNHYFSKDLQKKLIKHYGKLPSSAVIARDFSLLAADIEPVSVETVRKWLLGLTLPHPKRLRILQAWLGVDLNNSILDSSMGGNFPKIATPISLKSIELAKKIDALPIQKQKAVIEFIETIKKI